MKAWWAYWLTVAAGTVLWIGAVLALGRDGLRDALREPGWVVILVAPIFLAGLNLVAFRQSHETVCRLEAERHGWLRALVGRGYSARAFALTGLSLLGLGAVLLIEISSGLR